MISVVPSWWWTVCSSSSLVEQCGPVDAERRPCLGRAEGVQPGVAGQGQLDHPRREGAPGGLLGPLHRDPEQLGSGVLGVGVVLGLPDPVDPDRVEPGNGLGVAVDGSLDEGGLRVEVGAGEREEHAVLPAADPGDRDLRRRRWRRALHAADLDAVVAEVCQRGGVQVGGHVGVEVGGFTDLVDQLSGDRVPGDGAAGARVLGDHRGAVGGDLGDREPWLQEVGDGTETRRSCRRSPGARIR